MKLPIIGILSGVALATLSSGVAQAAIVVPPTGLAPGSEYRLVFVTSTSNATSSNIADYNTFVQDAARSSSVLNTALTAAGFNPLSINWTAIASTSAVNARVNTATQATDTSPPDLSFGWGSGCYGLCGLVGWIDRCTDRSHGIGFCPT